MNLTFVPQGLPRGLSVQRRDYNSVLFTTPGHCLHAYRRKHQRSRRRFRGTQVPFTVSPLAQFSLIDSSAEAQEAQLSKFEQKNIKHPYHVLFSKAIYDCYFRD